MRKSKHQDALDSAGPTAYYTEFDESKLSVSKTKRRVDTQELDDTTPPDAMQSPFVETIYGKDFAGGQQFMLGQSADNSIHSPEQMRAGMDEFGMPLLSSRHRVEVGGLPTEIILQKLGSNNSLSPSPKELTLDSSVDALKRSKKKLVLFGNNDSFDPNLGMVSKERLKQIILKEDMEM